MISAVVVSKVYVSFTHVFVLKLTLTLLLILFRLFKLKKKKNTQFIRQKLVKLINDFINFLKMNITFYICKITITSELKKGILKIILLTHFQFNCMVA